MGTRLDVTLTALAGQIAACLPARWEPTIGAIESGTPTLPAGHVALTWRVGEWLLGVAVDGPSAELLVSQENSIEAALSAQIAQVAVGLGNLLETGEVVVDQAETVDDIQAALQQVPGETRWLSIMDETDHRATVMVRLAITDFMNTDADSPAQPGGSAATPAAGVTTSGEGIPVAPQGSIGQQAGARLGMPSSSQSGDRFDSPLVAGVNPNDMPSSLGRTPGDAPMMPPNAIAHPAEFTAFDDYGQLGGTPHPMALLNDVELGVTAELGRTRLTVRDVLGLTPGSIIELDRSAGAPVDVVVNGTLIARGEVVVIDEEFGVRITQIMGMPDLAKANALELANDA